MIVASVGEKDVTCSKGVKIVADTTIKDCVKKTFDLIAVPGGLPGVENLRQSGELIGMLKRQMDEGRLYAAICAAPAVVLEPNGLLEGRRATCHPNFADRLSNKEYIGQSVVVDGNLVTSRGAGTAVEFALKLVGLVYSDQKEREIAEQIVYKKEG